MIRNGRVQKAETGDTAHKPLTCWGNTPVCDALAFELSDGRLFIFPKGHLVCAEYSGAAPLETIRLIFSTLEVQVAGHGLRALVFAIQTGAVSWIKCFSAAFDPLINADSGQITSITIQRTDTATD